MGYDEAWKIMSWQQWLAEMPPHEGQEKNIRP